MELPFYEELKVMLLYIHEDLKTCLSELRKDKKMEVKLEDKEQGELIMMDNVDTEEKKIENKEETGNYTGFHSDNEKIKKNYAGFYSDNEKIKKEECWFQKNQLRNKKDNREKSVGERELRVKQIVYLKRKIKKKKRSYFYKNKRKKKGKIKKRKGKIIKEGTLERQNENG